MHIEQTAVLYTINSLVFAINPKVQFIEENSFLYLSSAIHHWWGQRVVFMLQIGLCAEFLDHQHRTTFHLGCSYTSGLQQLWWSPSVQILKRYEYSLSGSSCEVPYKCEQFQLFAINSYPLSPYIISTYTVTLSSLDGGATVLVMHLFDRNNEGSK